MECDFIEPFKTENTSLAAYLRVNNCQIKNLSKKSNTKVEFIFSSVPKKMVTDFNSYQTQVEPNDYAATMKQLIHTAREFLKSG